MIPGIDISSHQQGPKGIDWPAVAAYGLGLHPEFFVIVKVSEGASPDTRYVNQYLHQQRQGAHAAGIKNVGLYHYGLPSKNSGSAEADWFMECVGNDGGVLAGEFYALDMEDTDLPDNADLDAYVLDFAGRVSRPFGRPIVLYSGKWYADAHNLNHDPKLADLGCWWASVGDTLPIIPEPWKSRGKNILLWQKDWHAKVPGIQGDVDLDYLVGGIETLRPYQWGSAPAPFDPTATDVPLDVDVPANSESLNDMFKVSKKMREHLDALDAVKQVQQVNDLALKLKSEIDWLVRASWGH